MALLVVTFCALTAFLTQAQGQHGKRYEDFAQHAKIMAAAAALSASLETAAHAARSLSGGRSEFENATLLGERATWEASRRSLGEASAAPELAALRTAFEAAIANVDAAIGELSEATRRDAIPELKEQIWIARVRLAALSAGANAAHDASISASERAYARRLGMAVALALIMLAIGVAALIQMRADASRAARAARSAHAADFASFTHEIGQPLHACGLYLDTLQQDVRDTRARHIVGRLVGIMATVQQQLLLGHDLARLIGPDGPARGSWTPIGGILTGVCREFGALARSQAVDLRCVGGSARLMTDSAETVRSAIRAMLTHAMRANDAKKLLIGVRPRRADLRIDLFARAEPPTEDGLAAANDVLAGDLAREGTIALAVLRQAAMQLGGEARISATASGFAIRLVFPR